ncbi:hypothetical protein IGI49_001845 [Enterococcus sp. AZ071]
MGTVRYFKEIIKIWEIPFLLWEVLVKYVANVKREER